MQKSVPPTDTSDTHTRHTQRQIDRHTATERETRIAAQRQTDKQSDGFQTYRQADRRRHTDSRADTYEHAEKHTRNYTTWRQL